MTKIKDIAPAVKGILEHDARYRDDDNKLISVIWWQEIGVHRIEDLTGKEVLRMLYDGELTPAESITRARRKIQELHPELLGEKRKKRRRQQEEEVKQELREWDQ